MTYFFIALLALVVFVLLLNWKKTVAGFDALKVFFSEVSFEVSKVTWPTRDEVVSGVILVGVVCIILTLMVGVADKALSELVKLMF